MRNKAAASRYAEGFLSYTQENIGVEKACAELTRLCKTILETEDLSEFLESLEVAVEEKFVFIDKVFKDNFSVEVRNFLRLLIKKRRITLFKDIVESAQVIYCRKKGIERLILKSAYPVENNLAQGIKNRLEKKLDKQLELEVSLDKKLIGGIQAIVGNLIIDGSIKRQLADLREHLLDIKIT